jgi:hypothetical protein
MIQIENIATEKGYCLMVKFSDGKIKIIDLSPFLEKGIFTQLRNQDFFDQVKNHNYFISWPGDQELSADTLYYIC